MGAITGAQLQTLTDSFAKQKAILDIAVGGIATADTILYGMETNHGRLDGYGDDALADLKLQFVNQKALMDTFKNRLNHNAIKALENHLRRLAGVGISGYWEAENVTRFASQFAEICRSIGIYLKPSLCFPPVTNMATFIASGTGAGTFTDGDLIDGNYYGPADLEGIITAVGGASVTGVATVIGTDENGAVVTGTITFAASALNEVVALVPDQTGKQFQDITNITIATFEADDAFTVRSKVDRSVSL